MEFFILGEDWSLYEEFLPRENFNEDEIRGKHSTRYFSADGRSIHECPHGVALRNISLAEIERAFGPSLQMTEKVLTCKFINPPDYYVANSFALIPRDNESKVKPGLYGEHENGIVTKLYGSGVRPLNGFAKEIAIPLSIFCMKYGLILLLHSEYPLDVTDPTELLNPENSEIG
jgi:hypothetical protein